MGWRWVGYVGRFINILRLFDCSFTVYFKQVTKKCVVYTKYDKNDNAKRFATEAVELRFNGMNGGAMSGSLCW